MKITTKFSPGDKAWVFEDERAIQLTVRRVMVTVTDSPGTGSDIFDNFKPQNGREEQYMCVESGIGSGRVYTLGEHIFDNPEDCHAANAEFMAQKEAEKQRRVKDEERRLLQRETTIRLELAHIEQLKLSKATA